MRWRPGFRHPFLPPDPTPPDPLEAKYPWLPALKALSRDLQVIEVGAGAVQPIDQKLCYLIIDPQPEPCDPEISMRTSVRGPRRTVLRRVTWWLQQRIGASYNPTWSLKEWDHAPYAVVLKIYQGGTEHDTTESSDEKLQSST
jgi:hypothetical protein